MPYLNKLPDKIETYIFEPEGNKLPKGDAILRFFIHLFNVPIINRIIEVLLKNKLGFSPCTSIVPGFRCITGNIYCGKQVGLCDTFFVDYVPIYIGNNVRFSYKNILITSKHDFKNFNRVISKSIIIEDNVWITTDVIVLSGVRIGRNSVIGAGSVVTKDIPANVFAAGNPCKPIKNIERQM